MEREREPRTMGSSVRIPIFELQDHNQPMCFSSLLPFYLKHILRKWKNKYKNGENPVTFVSVLESYLPFLIDLISLKH